MIVLVVVILYFHLLAAGTFPPSLENRRHACLWRVSRRISPRERDPYPAHPPEWLLESVK